MYGECDFCHQFRSINTRNRFCRECLKEWRRVEDGNMLQYLPGVVGWKDDGDDTGAANG